MLKLVIKPVYVSHKKVEM